MKKMQFRFNLRRALQTAEDREELRKRESNIFSILWWSAEAVSKVEEALPGGNKPAKLHKYWLCPPSFQAQAVLVPHIMWLLSPKNCLTYEL